MGKTMERTETRKSLAGNKRRLSKSASPWVVALGRVSSKWDQVVKPKLKRWEKRSSMGNDVSSGERVR